VYQAVFIAYLTQGLLLGLAALALLAAAPRLQKRYGPQWLCRLWVTLAVLFLVPVRALVPQAPAAVSVSAAPLYTPVTVLQEETTQKPAGNVPYRTTTAADNTTHYIVPRTEIQTGRRTILERLAINTTRGNLAALVWELGILAVAVYQFGGYAVWRIRVGRNAQPVAKSWRDALPQGQCPQMQATPLVRSPMVAGALHPVLLVPAGEAPKGADCMLAHELTHIKRHDVAKKLLLTLVCILHWYNPAVWLLSARAGRDIEEACDAETLHGRDAAYRAAYADALMTAVRRNCGPALTSGFALSKRQLKQRMTALWDTAPKRRGRTLLAALALTACCAGSLVACQVADPPTQETPEPSATAESTAEPESLDPNRRNPVDTEYLMRLSLAAERAANYWQHQLDENAIFYMTARVGMSGVVDPADDAELAELLDNIAASDGTDYRARLDDGDGFVVKVSFYVVYSPEYNYSGVQYTDGTNSIYIYTPVDDGAECIPLSGWKSAQNGSAIPETSDEARALKLNEWQYTMLTHQCRALAAAGIIDFTSPADWTDEQMAYYLAARSRDYGPNQLGFDADHANMMLTIDFTEEDDWSNNIRFFAADWPGTTVLAEDLPDTPYYAWEYEGDGKTVTATGSVDGTPAVQYTFSVYPGTELKFDARTVIVGGHSLT
jgi:beta-lactamase regulating signal transducer with metallopeptidase domain